MHPYSVLVAAAASGLVSAQQQAAAGCTAKSFAIPSWMVENFQYTTAGKTSFHITNRATNYTADLTCVSGGTCSNQGKPWSNDTLQASVQVSGSFAEILVNQIWTCNDRNATRVAPFVAYGNGSLAIDSNGQAAPSPLLIKGSLVSPVAITPQYATGPTGHANPGCAAASNAAWTLSAPFYTNQTGDGVTAVASQDFNVVLKNVATGYEASCMSGAGFGDGLTPTPSTGLLNLVCAGSEFQSSNGGRYSINTAATFDPSTFTFTVNQTWYCDDVSAAKPVQVIASAKQSLPLSCSSALVSSDTDGTSASTKTSCISHTDVSIKAQSLSNTSLLPYSIEEPTTGPDGCTISSIYRPQWRFSAFEVDTDQKNVPSVYFEIILVTGSPGFQFPISIMQDATPLAGGDGSWYNCVVGPAGDIGEPLWPTACSFKYEAATKKLTLRADWTCAELDADHPISFSGTSTSTVSQPLVCETVNGESRCTTEDGAYRWNADISNVTWHQ